MKKYFRVLYKIGDTYSSNICLANEIRDILMEYSKYQVVDVVEAKEGEVEEARRKRMPIVNVPKAKEPLPEYVEVCDKFMKWLVNMGYLEESDIKIDKAFIEDDFRKVKECAPRLYNLWRIISG